MTKRTVLLASMSFLLLVAGAVGAWACTNLATINLSETHVAPGARVDVTGSSFRAIDEGVQPVQIRWGAADGQLLAEAEPGPSGTVSATITVPADAQPGQYVLVASQLAAEPGHGLEAEEETFSPIFGTPARAALVVGTSGAPEPVGPAGAPAGIASDGGSTALLAISGLLALLAVGLFGGALGLFVRELRGRRAGQPATSPLREGRSHTT